MKRLLLGSVALATTLIAGRAVAADMPVKAVYKAPPPVAVYSWTGFYIGANGGYGWGNRNASFTPIDPVTAENFGGLSGSPLPSTSYHTRGGLGGVQIGFNQQFGQQLVAGLEVDFDASDIKGSGSSTNHIDLDFVGPVPGAATVSDRLKWFGTVRARLGYLITDAVLLYATGGVAYGRVDQDANYISTRSFGIGNVLSGFSFSCVVGTPCFLGSSSRARAGFTVGTGTEWALFMRNFTFKAEYLYVNLGGGQSFPMTATATLGGEPTPSSIAAQYSRSDFHIVRVGLNYRFGDPALVAKY